MKHLRATARVDTERAPSFFTLLATDAAVEEARILSVNTTPDGSETMLIAIDGDPSTFADRATETTGVESVTLSGTRNDRTFALVVMRPLETPMFDAIHRAAAAPGIVALKPIVYRDGRMYGRAVGDPQALQRGLETVPEAIDVRIDEIGRFRGELDDPRMRLSERQREAVDAALELGYYDQPRGATHEDVAERLDCAPQTASDHLQKAEAKLVRAAMDQFGRGV